MSSVAESRLQGAATLLLGLALGCEGTLSAEDPASMRAEPASATVPLGEDDWSHVPVPPADGPELAPLAMAVPIRVKPRTDAETAGVLRVGARVARSAEPVSLRDCPGGWYAVRPFGFVCAGAAATVKLDDPLARALQVEPDRSKPMPYKYAFVRAIAPNYMRIPTAVEQSRHEQRLERHLRNYHRLRADWDALDVGANDVPLDERGMAIGGIPDHARPMNDSERFGGKGDDAVPWWLQGERRIGNIASFRVPGYAVISDRVRRHAGVALIGTFVAGEKEGRRRFAISTDARLLPADKLKADSGSPFHGQDIRHLGLPLAFGCRPDTDFHSLENNRLEKLGPVARRELIPLSGAVKLVGKLRMVQARDGRWLSSSKLCTISKPSSLPAWAKRGTKWIDISLLNQTLTLWEGDVAVYATLVATGRDGLGEPGKTLSTPQGTFRIYQKHVTTTMDSDVAEQEFELRDVPWVMYFKGGYAVHASYWHDDFGRPRSHGCVNLAPIDARYVFHWSSPSVPDHWHAMNAGDHTEKGTIVHIHP